MVLSFLALLSFFTSALADDTMTVSTILRRDNSAILEVKVTQVYRFEVPDPQITFNSILPPYGTFSVKDSTERTSRHSYSIMRETKWVVDIPEIHDGNYRIVYGGSSLHNVLHTDFTLSSLAGCSDFPVILSGKSFVLPEKSNNKTIQECMQACCALGSMCSMWQWYEPDYTCSFDNKGSVDYPWSENSGVVVRAVGGADVNTVLSAATAIPYTPAISSTLSISAPTSTSIPHTSTSAPHTSTSIPHTSTSIPHTSTSVPHTSTSAPSLTTSAPDESSDFMTQLGQLVDWRREGMITEEEFVEFKKLLKRKYQE